VSCLISPLVCVVCRKSEEDEPRIYGAINFDESLGFGGFVYFD
jgi:hypothetical protein